MAKQRKPALEIFSLWSREIYVSFGNRVYFCCVTRPEKTSRDSVSTIVESQFNL